ncbi:MAG: histidine phosphatase family protein [Alphaproteobacteria bacterium]|nr:histidine phosphatase family protein [Alphaproteobacteria bacterium]
MKRLILMRHAQAQLEQFGKNDRDRAITMAGMHELESIRSQLKTQLAGVELVMCSNAKRTRQTLEGIRPLLPSTTKIDYDDDLYLASYEALWQKVRTIPQQYEIAMIIGHNPAVHQFAQNISMGTNFYGFTTCSLVICESTRNHWQQMTPHAIRLSEFMKP